MAKRVKNKKLRLRVRLTLCTLSLCSTAAFGAGGQAKGAPKPVTVCELLKHPARYNGKIVRVSGREIAGFERDDLNSTCDGRIMLWRSLYDPDKIKYGFLTDPQSLDAEARKFYEEHPGSNLNSRLLRIAGVTVVGLFRCHYDFPDCKNISRDGDTSIVIKSLAFDEPDKPARKMGPS